MTGKLFWFSVLALSARLFSPGVVVSEATPIPPLCDGTVQTECLLGDSGWSVTIPAHVRITFMGLDRPTTSREDTWFLKTYDAVDFSPVTLQFNPFQPERIKDSFFRVDELVTNKTATPFNTFLFTTKDPQNDACSTFHPDEAHLHPDGTGAPNPDFGGATQWDGLLPVAGRCARAGHQNDGTDRLVVQGRRIAPDGTWNPTRIRLHEPDGDTWFLTEQVVPEPSTFVLSSGALVLLFAYLRSRRKQGS
jgi:hypothetical protein